MKKTSKLKSVTKKQGARKLVVKPETVRPLSPDQVGKVAGGWTPSFCMTCSCNRC